MSEITWADLDTDEQRVMGVVKTYGYVLSDDEVDDGWVAPKCDPEVATRLQEYDLLLCLGKVSPYNYKYVFTPAGRALLPAGEAVDTWASLTQFDLDQLGITREQAEQFDSQPVETTNTANTVASLQADLAAALARAQAAEGELKQAQARIIQLEDGITAFASLVNKVM